MSEITQDTPLFFASDSGCFRFAGPFLTREEAKAWFRKLDIPDGDGIVLVASLRNPAVFSHEDVDE